MTLIPVYRVVSMEASEYRNLYNYEITLQPIPEDEAIDLAKGRVMEEYERPAKQRVNVSEDTFHSLRVGMIYQIAFAPAQFKEVA